MKKFHKLYLYIYLLIYPVHYICIYSYKTFPFKEGDPNVAKYGNDTKSFLVAVTKMMMTTTKARIIHNKNGFNFKMIIL